MPEAQTALLRVELSGWRGPQQFGGHIWHGRNVLSAGPACDPARSNQEKRACGMQLVRAKSQCIAL